MKHRIANAIAAFGERTEQRIYDRFGPRAEPFGGRIEDACNAIAEWLDPLPPISFKIITGEDR